VLNDRLSISDMPRVSCNWRQRLVSPRRTFAPPRPAVITIRFALLSAIALGLLTFAATTQADAASRWIAKAVPMATGARHEWLAAVSCSSPGTCMAVGSFTNRANHAAILALRWNGVKWSIEPAPKPTTARNAELTGVSCRSWRFCVAVGDSQSGKVTSTLVERWNGARWSIQSSANAASSTDSEFDDVSCTTTHSCTAVGTFASRADVSFPLVERWNGSRWRIQHAPQIGDSSTLLGVSCASDRACAAVGVANGDEAITQWWNGLRWTAEVEISDMDEESGLGGISCTSRNVCTAVGGTGNSAGEFVVIERWNGKTWTFESVDTDSGTLYGVSCPSSSACTTVGTDGGFSLLVGRSNGTKWTLQDLPAPGGHGGSLIGVSCATAATCMTVGYATNNSSHPISLLLAPNGTARLPEGRG